MLPAPFILGAHPMDGNTGGVIVSKSGLADLATYIIEERSWIEAASRCLGAPQPEVAPQGMPVQVAP